MLRNLTAVVLLTTVPAFASAEGISASLSASFGNQATAEVSVFSGTVVTPESVSVSGAAGAYAVSSSVATASSSGAASGATDDADNTPMVSVTPDSTGAAYETEVTFAPSNFQQIADDAAAAAVADLCAGITAQQTGTAVDTDVDLGPVTVTFPGDVTEGSITVTCP